MKSENKNCKNCKRDFVIEIEDFKFYEKIKVPPPTWCRECRQMRRMSFRNERTLYKRKCDKTGKDIISIFSPDSLHKVYDHKYWNSDKFDPMEFGQDFDFSKPFFEQYKELLLNTPLPSLRIENSVNSDYNNDISDSENLYLCARTHVCKNMLYTYRGNSSRDCADCMQVIKGSEFLYECIECIGCSHSSYLYFSENCSNSSMLWNCKNSLDCFMSSNLRNKQYVFKNIQLSKEEYNQKIAEYNSGSFKAKKEALEEFIKINQASIKKNLNIMNSPNSNGDNIVNSKNSFLCFGVKSTENVRYLWDVMKYKDSMDAYSGGRDSELIYECTATAAAYNCHFCYRASSSTDISYSIFVKNSKNLFGCIGLKNKEYCILNKQYTKDSYEALLPKIIKYMTESREYGEFFPMSLSMFPYNDTVAEEYFPMTKEEVLNSGLKWQDPDTKSYTITIKPEGLPDDIKSVTSEILTEVIGCTHNGNCLHGCTTAFRIIPRELEFYKRMNIPLPRLCPNCRHYDRLAKLNPLKLWTSKCQCAGIESDGGIYKNLAPHHLHNNEHCPNKFETSYSPDHKDIVYCETCYQQEVY